MALMSFIIDTGKKVCKLKGNDAISLSPFSLCPPAFHTASSIPPSSPSHTDRTCPLSTGLCCCIVRLEQGSFDRLLLDYQNHLWLDDNEQISEARASETPADQYCRIERLRPEQEAQAARLPELDPPRVLPKGNVGTPVSLMRELVRACQLPPKLLQEVGLDRAHPG